MPISPAEHAAAEVRAEMARRQIKQQDLAAALDLSQASLSRRLAGAVPFTVTELAQVAVFLDVPLMTLVGAA